LEAMVKSFQSVMDGVQPHWVKARDVG
jgi:hypothetical protein